MTNMLFASGKFVILSNGEFIRQDDGYPSYTKNIFVATLWDNPENPISWMEHFPEELASAQLLRIDFIKLEITDCTELIRNRNEYLKELKLLQTKYGVTK